MAKEKGSGRGLDAIFIDNYEIEETNQNKIVDLRIHQVEPEPTQPRTVFDQSALEELASSIATHGLLQPIVVREYSEGIYRIIAGERRWRASKMAGLVEVPAIIIEADDKKAAELSLIENLQREDLSPLEEAEAYKALIDDHDLTQEELSARIGKSRSAISNTMRLLALPKEVLQLIKDEKLTAGHARALLALSNNALIIPTANKAVERELSVRQLEKYVKELNKSTKSTPQAAPQKIEVDYIADLEKRVTTQMGRLFKIKPQGKHKKIEIEYSDERDLEDIIKKLCGNMFFDE